MTSLMISQEGLIAPLSVADKPSIKDSTQLLIQSEHKPIVPKSRSPDLASGGQSSGTVCTFSNTQNIVNADDQQSLCFSSNPQLLNIDLKSPKNLSSSNDSGISLRSLSPPILSDSCSNAIQSSASIKGNYAKDSHISNNMKFNNEGDCFADKSDIQFQSKIDENSKILQHEQNINNLRDISTPSPPNVPFSSNEIHKKPELITMNNFAGESNKKINGYENQATPVYYQSGYDINNNHDHINNYPSFNSNPQYYTNSIQVPLYQQYSQQNNQFLPANQKVIPNAYYKQQKGIKNQKVQYQQMCLWQSQQQNQQQLSQYQYFRYPNSQIQPMNLNNFNMYGNYQHIIPTKNELTSSYQQNQSFGSNPNLNLNSSVYQSGRVSPGPYPININMVALPYQMPNQEQQQFLIYDEDTHQINNSIDSTINNQNDPQSLNNDSSMSSKMNLMMNYSTINHENLNQPISKNEISFSQSRAPKQRNSSSKSLLKTASLKIPHYLHHHHHHHQTPNTELVPPDPIYYNDKTLGKYGIRCVCGKGSITTGVDPTSSTDSRSTNSKTKTKKSKKGRSKQTKSTASSSEISAINEPEKIIEKSENEPEEATKYAPNSMKTTTLLVQCDVCHFWLHGLCVNVARVEESDTFICPFCQGKQIFCTKCNENMNYSNPLIKCTKCGYWVHKECEGLAFGVNPQNFVCRNCGGLGEDAVYDIPYVKFIQDPQQSRRKPADINPVDISLLLNNNESEKSKNEEDENASYDANCNEVDLDAFFDQEIPDLTVFTPSSGGLGNDGSSDLFENESVSQILDSIPDGIFKQAVLYDLNKSELEYRPTIEKYFHEFAPLLFDYSHEFWRVFKDTLSKLLKVDAQTVMKSIDSLANHFIYMPTSSLSIKQQLTNDDDENDDEEGEKEKIFFESQSSSSFVNSESITKYLDSLNMIRLEKQPTPVEIYCSKKDGRVYSTASLDDNSFICDIPGFLMHTDEVRVEDEGIPKTCFLVTDMDLVIDTKGTDFEYFAPRIRRGFHFNAVVKLVRIQGEIRLGLFAMKMKALLSSEEKLKKGPAIFENGEIVLPLDGTIPFPVQKIQWKDKKKHQKPASNENSNNKGKLNANLAVNDHSNKTKNNEDEEVDDDDDEDDDDNETRSLNQSSKASNQSIIMTRNQEKRKKAELKLEKKNRDEQISKLSLLSSFYDDSVQAFPFILLDDDEAVEKYKSQMEMKATKAKNGKGKR